MGILAGERIQSIDALRGFDMLMIIFLDRFFITLHRGADTTVTAALAEQFDHPEWFGFHVYDIVMPLFLFVVGAVIPYSLGKIRDTNAGLGPVYGRLGRRFVILFILGWIVQGNLLEWDLERFRLFSNTLQAIAVGYVGASLAFLHLSRRARYGLFAACLVGYALILTLPEVPGVGRSVLLPDRNYALYFDRLVLGRFDDGLQYTWLLTGLGFLATTLSGLFAGELIKSDQPRARVARQLLLLGVAGVALGLIWGIWHPIVKKLWSNSFVLFSSGICCLLLAGVYWLIDVKGYRKWAFPLRVIGMNAITAYVLSHVFSFPEIANSVLFGLEQFVGNYQPLLLTIGGFGVLYALLWYMYRNRTFVKV